MSVDSARAMLVAQADFGEGLVQAFAKRVLEEWGTFGPGGPRRPMTDAERSKRWRDAHRVTAPDTPASRNDTASVTNDTATVTGPSRALPLPSPLGSSLSSSGSISPSEPLFPEGSNRSTGAREGAGHGGSAGHPKASTSPFATANAGPLHAVATRRDTAATRNDTTTVTAATRGDTEANGAPRPLGKKTRIPSNWQPSPKTSAWCEGRGVDAGALVEEFVEHWSDEREARTERGWQKTFMNRVEALLERGRAPMLPPAPPPPPPRGDPSQAKSVRDVLSGIALPAILEAKGADHG